MGNTVGEVGGGELSRFEVEERAGNEGMRVEIEEG